MENFENSTPELDALVEISCAQEGVYARGLPVEASAARVALVSLRPSTTSPRQLKPSISRERAIMERPTNALLEMVPWCTSERCVASLAVEAFLCWRSVWEKSRIALVVLCSLSIRPAKSLATSGR